MSHHGWSPPVIWTVNLNTVVSIYFQCFQNLLSNCKGTQLWWKSEIWMNRMCGRWCLSFRRGISGHAGGECEISSLVRSDERHFQRCSCRNSALATLTGTDNASFKHSPSWVTSGDVLFDREQVYCYRDKQACGHSAAAGTAAGDKNTRLWNLNQWYMVWYFGNIIRQKRNTIIGTNYWQSKPKHLQNTIDSSIIS